MLRLLVFTALLLLVMVAGWPGIDLALSHIFFDGQIFPAAQHPLWDGLHEAAVLGSRLLAVGLVLGLLATLMLRRRFWLDSRGWLFLVLVLGLGPGLLANALLKDHWGRARPSQVVEFGGTKTFTPFWQPTDQCVRNCSFVAGDGSFGFALHALGYVVTRRRRLAFWGGVGAGLLLGGNRIMMGGHFLSDVIAGGLLMLAVAAALHGMVFGWAATRRCWSEMSDFRSSKGKRIP